MKKKIPSLIWSLLILCAITFSVISCEDDSISSDYYPPVLEIGFDDISDVTISNDEPNPNGGQDSTYVRLFKLVSDNSNDALDIDVFFNFFNYSSGLVDTTVINKYIRLMNPILRTDSLNIDGTSWGKPWLCSRANFSVGTKHAAIMIRTIDKVQGVPKTPGSPSQATFLLKLIPDTNYPARYTVDEAKSSKKVTVIDNKQL